MTDQEKANERKRYVRTEKTEMEIQLGFRRGSESLLNIVRAKQPRDCWLVGAVLAARARARIVLAALEANQFFSVWVPVWIDRAAAAQAVGNHARAAYYRALANAGRDAQRDAMQSARGDDLHKVIIWLDGKSDI